MALWMLILTVEQRQNRGYHRRLASDTLSRCLLVLYVGLFPVGRCYKRCSGTK